MHWIPPELKQQIAREGGQTHCLPVLWKSSDRYTHVEVDRESLNDVHVEHLTGELVCIEPISRNPLVVGATEALETVLRDNRVQHVRIAEGRYLITGSRTFDTLIHHLKSSLTSRGMTARKLNDVAHAYLVCGSRPTNSLGDTALARALSGKSLLQ